MTTETQTQSGSTGSTSWKNIGIRLGLIALATLWLALMAVTWAEEADAAENSNDEYSFNWLDPDKKIYVLQNRRYTKAHRILLSALAGAAAAGPYRTTYSIEPRAAYYFSEWLGVEAFYTVFMSSENSAFEALKKASPSTLPVVRVPKSQLGALVHYVPWYAKINVFNQILYFDWYFSGGAGQITQDMTSAGGSGQETPFALYLGTGHQYHLNQLLTVRLDFMTTFYNAPIFGATGDKTWYSNYTFGVGLGVRL